MDELERLARLPPLEYDQQREAAAKKLGVRLTTLDEEVKNARCTALPNDSVGVMNLELPQAWPHEVDGAELLDEIEKAVRRYTVTADHVPGAVALWVAFTWTIDFARIAPILAITSPEKRCGKTTLLALLAQIVRKPLPASNISPAAVFRAIETWTPTLLIDEADTFIRKNEELRGVLNSGHSRSSAFVIRTTGDDHEPRQFSTWGAKVVAMIGNLPDTLADRAIPVAMRRKLPSEQVARLRGAPYEALCQKLARWSSDHASSLGSIEPEIPAGLNDRAADNWEILLGIADRVGGRWPAKARNAALALSGDATGTESVKTMLLADMHQLLETAESLSSSDLAKRLATIEERPWSEFGRTAKPITPRRIASLLSDFGISPSKFSTHPVYGPGTRGYTLASIQDAYHRYVSPSASAKAPKASIHAPSGDLRTAKNGETLAHSATRKACNHGPDGALAVTGKGKG